VPNPVFSRFISQKWWKKNHSQQVIQKQTKRKLAHIEAAAISEWQQYTIEQDRKRIKTKLESAQIRRELDHETSRHKETALILARLEILLRLRTKRHQAQGQALTEPNYINLISSEHPPAHEGTAQEVSEDPNQETNREKQEHVPELHYYSAYTDLPSLIQTRFGWDKYLDPGGSSIPTQFILPPPPSTKLWEKYVLS